MVPYETILLDLDLTLFDFRASERLAFADCMAAVDAADRQHEIFPRYLQINGALWAGVERGELTPDEAGSRRFEQLFHEFDLTGGDPYELSDLFQHGLGAHGELYPGAAAVLDELAAGARLGLVTNGLSAVQRAKIDRLGLDGWFSAIVISAEVGVAKPDPAMFDLAFEALGSPDRTAAVMVGDSLSSDIAGGRAAAIATCWYRPDPATPSPTVAPDHVVASLDELPNALLR